MYEFFILFYFILFYFILFYFILFYSEIEYLIHPRFQVSFRLSNITNS
jgi:hypothetical protein